MATHSDIYGQTDVPGDNTTADRPITAPPTANGTGATQVLAYFIPLILLVNLVTPLGYLVDFPVSYMLKDQLHSSASAIALFRFLSVGLVYFSIAFGLVRDLWNPFGRRDRGFFLLFGPLTALIFVGLAFVELSYARLFVGILLATAAFLLVTAAFQGLAALIGQERMMTGRLSVVFVIISSAPAVLGALASGWISDHLSPRATFLFVALLALGIGLMGLWKPRAIFTHTYDRDIAKGSDFVGDIKRLLRHRAVYPAALTLLLFNFSPGANTPLQFYLTNTLHASKSAYGNFYAIFILSFLPITILYGYLCRRVALKKLLFWGTIITIPQMIPLAFIHSATGALWLAVPAGLMGSIASAAYVDLAMRSCPAGLQGTLMMLVAGLAQLSARGGDVLGAWIYGASPAHGFLYCVIATSAAYALILPFLLLIPAELVATTDG